MRHGAERGYQPDELYELANRDLHGRAEPEEEVYLRSSPEIASEWLEVLKTIKRQVEQQHKFKRLHITRWRARLAEGEIDDAEYRGRREEYEEWRAKTGYVLTACENRIQEAKRIANGREVRMR